MGDDSAILKSLPPVLLDQPSDMHSVDLTTAASSFLLINDSEELVCRSEDDFLHGLKLSQEDKVKVVSIFGNTGDGKSFTLNNTFFEGANVFKTSSAQTSCTIGVWTMYDSKTKVLCLDTEGMLGITKREKQRTRLLLKILAISDVVIYQTRAPRLHRDMYNFLGGASQAYNEFFSKTLEDLLRKSGSDKMINSLGPTVIVFHETQHTDTLDHGPEVTETAVDSLRATFNMLNLNISAFSSIRYVGIKSENKPTCFEPLKRALNEELKRNDVRSPRQVKYIYLMLKYLNDKFNNSLSETPQHLYWSNFFSCQEKCMSCNSACKLSMGHKDDGEPHMSNDGCKFQHQYQNSVNFCKACYQNGQKNLVKESTHSNHNTSWSSYINYAWSGSILECSSCGEIYKSRQYWYGNMKPEDCGVVVQENIHVWSGERMIFGTQNAAQKVLDSVSSLTDVVASVGSQPTQILSDWVTDKINPSYWVPNHEIRDCYICAKMFLPSMKKHHCRACGKGCCEKCSSRRQSVPSRGWHHDVRVCDRCYKEQPPSLTNATDGSENRARVIGETVVNSMSAVKSVLNISKDFIKDSVRPSYWTPDAECVDCWVCKKPFNDQLVLHHCRDCGKGVCNNCSQTRKAVPLRGWDTPVRVCNKCC